MPSGVVFGLLLPEGTEVPQESVTYLPTSQKTCSCLGPQHHLLKSLKTVFLVAITLPRTVSKLQALMADPPYMTFHKDTVVLKPHPKTLRWSQSFIWIHQLTCPSSSWNPALHWKRKLHIFPEPYFVTLTETNLSGHLPLYYQLFQRPGHLITRSI